MLNHSLLNQIGISTASHGPSCNTRETLWDYYQPVNALYSTRSSFLEIAPGEHTQSKTLLFHVYSHFSYIAQDQTPFPSYNKILQTYSPEPWDELVQLRHIPGPQRLKVISQTYFATPMRGTRSEGVDMQGTPQSKADSESTGRLLGIRTENKVI